jgi:pyrimidine operon attenuation protein / uracil phosphoribosyltransferase
VAASKTIGPREISAAVTRLADAISSRHGRTPPVLLLGIANGGMELARRLAHLLRARVGTVDISFHRDDFGRHPIPKEFAPTLIPTDVHDATVILVDDVIFSGRTVKAALDELFDHGRPNKVELAVLVDRGGRKLPVSADYVGIDLVTDDTQNVVVNLDANTQRRDSIRIEPSAAPAPTPRKS